MKFTTHRILAATPPNSDQRINIGRSPKGLSAGLGDPTTLLDRLAEATLSLGASLSFLCLMHSICLAAISPSEWQFSKTILVAEQGRNGYIRVPLDGEVYGRSQLTLADLRVIDAQGNEVPYSLMEEKSQTTTEEYTPRVYNRAIVPQAYTTFTLDLGHDVFHNTLHFRTSSENFKRWVEIAGSPDGKKWLIVKKDAYVFDFTGEQKIQLTQVSYPESAYRYLLVKIWNGRERPLDLDGIAVSYEKIVTPTRTVRSQHQISCQQDSKLKATVVVLDLDYANLPWDHLTLETPEDNFARLVEVQGSNDCREWQRHVQSEYYRFHTEKFDLEKNSIQFPEARQRYAKLIIYNYDDPPLRLNRIEVRGVDKELVLQYQANWNIRLLYGNPMVTPPRYDIDRIKSYLNLDNLPQAALAAEANNPEHRLRQRVGPWTEVHPVIYWGALILLVLSLGAYIMRLLTKTKIDG